MKGIHGRHVRYQYLLFSLLILFINTLQAAFWAGFEWGEGEPDGNGPSAAAACQNLAANVNAWDSQLSYVFNGIVSSEADIPNACGDNPISYPACLFDSADQCQDVASVSGFPDVIKTYSIEIVPRNGVLNMIAPKGTGGTSILHLMTVVRDQDNKTIEGIKVRLDTHVKINSGGHNHDNELRHINHTGTLSGTPIAPNTVTGVTGINGYNFTFSSPVVSGDHIIRASCVDINCSSASLDNILVGISDLIPLGAGNWVLIGDKPYHPINHYLTDESIRHINSLANGYANIYSQVLYLNDASLERGGLFDIWKNWAPPHHEHRKGSVIDVRANNNTGAIPSANWGVFQNLIRLQGGTSILEHSYDSLTGEEVVSNRHFHVRLEGRSE